MYNKTIWNPGDIITQEKWDNINNNLSILGAYQLSVTIEEKEEEEGNTKVASSSSSSSNFYITIHKSYDEIIKLLKQGVICWYFNNLDGTIDYIIQFNDSKKQLVSYNEVSFYFNGTEMANFITVTELPSSDIIK